MFLAYQLDKDLRGSRIYQSILYLPVVIAPAVIGLIAELISRRRRACSTASSRIRSTGTLIDWLGNPSINLWAVLVFAVLAARRAT